MTFMEHIIIPTHSGVLACIQNNYRETGTGWNVGDSLAAAILHDCDKPACHCAVTISKQKGHHAIPNGLHIPHPILKQVLPV